MSHNTSSLISSIYESRKNVLNQMERQGYYIDDYANFSINEVNSMKQNNQLDMLLKMKDDVKDKDTNLKVYIKYYLGKTLRVNNIQDIISDLFEIESILTKNDCLFIISKDDVNDTLMNDLKQIWEKYKIFVVVQGISRLKFNILDHVLVPKHELISDDELKQVMTRYNIKDLTEFPEISRFDPVAQAICLRPNQVCKITRPSKTAIQTYYYRVCV